MTDNNRMRKGSLQFYPRVRAKNVIPSVNWKPVSKEGTGFMGFVGYKVAMISAWIKDDTDASLTKGKRIAVPATILECPPMRIYSVRFYKDRKVSKEFVVADDKELKRSVKIQKKKAETNFDSVLEYDDVRAIMFSEIKSTGIGKKKVDMIEVGISGDVSEKLNFIKEHIGKSISVTEVFSSGLIDTRAVTKGFGNQGPVKRFGIALKDHKSEKGRRRPGSLAPWHPARVTFRAPQAGQTGYQNRVSYNNLILEVGKISEKDINQKGGFEHYGVIKTDYIILKGSVPGPKKRGIVLSSPLRPSKRLTKKSFEVMEMR